MEYLKDLLPFFNLFLIALTLYLTRRDKAAAGNTDLSKAHLTESADFRRELRTEVKNLKDEIAAIETKLKEEIENLRAADKKIAALENIVSKLKIEKELIEKEKQLFKKDNELKEEELIKLRARVRDLENELHKLQKQVEELKTKKNPSGI